jgi:hypothetical protein
MTGHLAEYVPWFRKSMAALDTVAKRYEGRSVGHCSSIIEAVATGIPFKFMSNVRPLS